MSSPVWSSDDETDHDPLFDAYIRAGRPPSVDLHRPERKDACAICQKPLLADPMRTCCTPMLFYCRYGCGNAVHLQCRRKERPGGRHVCAVCTKPLYENVSGAI